MKKVWIAVSICLLILSYHGVCYGGEDAYGSTEAEIDTGKRICSPVRLALDFPQKAVDKMLERKREEIPSPSKLKMSRPAIHGYYFNRNYFNTKSTGDKPNYELRQDMRLAVSQNIGDQLDYLVSVDGKYHILHLDYGKFVNTEERFRLWECYATYSSGDFNLRVGRQVIRWGKGDEINPTDGFTPEDLTENLNFFSRAERKMPALMAKVDYAFEPYRLEAIWLPFFEPSRLPEANSEWEPYLYRYYRSLNIPINDSGMPNYKLESGVGAIKITRSTESYDVSASYAYHYDELPAPYLIALGTLPPPFSTTLYKVEQKYYREHTIGSDFEAVVDKFTFRGEFAYTLGKRFLSYSTLHPDTMVKKDQFFGIIGGDYTFPTGNVYLNIQYFTKFIPDHEEDMTNQSYEDGFLVRISKKFLNDTLLIEADGLIYVYDVDYYYQLKCDYDINDFLKLMLGYEVYAGELDKTFGQYKKNDHFFAKLKYSF